MCTSTHFFLGANSGRGFQSLFDRFCEPADFDDLLVLKGSAGCGKSTMMRRIGEAMEERGEEVEYLHCSGDPDSLDGVHIPRLRTAVVDGTAPHGIAPLGHPVKRVRICKGLRNRFLDGTSTGRGYLGHFYGTGIQKQGVTAQQKINPLLMVTS